MDNPTPTAEALLARAYEELDEESYGSALDLAREAIALEPEAPAGYYVAGIALFELAEYSRARDYLREAYARADADPIVATYYGAARFILGEEREAAVLLTEAVRADPELTEARYWLSMVLERQGRLGEADQLLAECARLEPDQFPVPYRMHRDELQRDLEEVIRELPERVALALRDVPIVIEDLPSRAMMEGAEHLAPDILGLFVGVALGEGSVFDSVHEPNVVYLFQRNLERVSGSREELLEEARITLVHEIGHYLGLDEDELAERGLD
jgi:predicted Zn-dependent protease with MMP-like domain